MKKLIVILLLGTLTYGMVGFVLMFKLTISQVRQNMQARIEHNTGNQALAVLNYNSFTHTDFSEIENSELSYKGERYDIVRQEKSSDGSIVFYCLEDEPETTLISHLSGDVGNNLDSQSHTNTLRFYQFMVDLFVFSPIKYHIYPAAQIKTALIAANLRIDGPFIGLQVPPPKQG